MADFRIDIDRAALDHIKKLLDTMPANVQRKVIGQASTKSLKPLVATARSLVPRETGLLRKSLGTVQRKYNRKGLIISYVGPRTGFDSKDASGKKRNPLKYAHLVEYGTKPHRIGETGRHPGSAPRPFLRKAFDQHKVGVLKSMETQIAAGIDREASRMTRKR